MFWRNTRTWKTESQSAWHRKPPYSRIPLTIKLSTLCSTSVESVVSGTPSTLVLQNLQACIMKQKITHLSNVHCKRCTLLRRSFSSAIGKMQPAMLLDEPLALCSLAE